MIHCDHSLIHIEGDNTLLHVLAMAHPDRRKRVHRQAYCQHPDQDGSNERHGTSLGRLGDWDKSGSARFRRLIYQRRPDTGQRARGGGPAAAASRDFPRNWGNPCVTG